MENSFKNIKKLLILTMMLLTCVTTNTEINASENTNTSYEFAQISENLYEEIIISENTYTRATKSGTKTVNYKTATGTILWSVSVHGSFTYNGSTSSCTSSTVTTTCPASLWKIVSKSATKSGNQAIGNATANYHSYNVPIRTISREVRLTCSKSGVLS